VSIISRASIDVPQIWVTYSEFAALIDCDPTEARKASIAAGLHRRKSRDGETRVKLTSTLATTFLDMLVRQSLEWRMTACADDLRSAHELMQEQFLAAPPSSTQSLRANLRRY
jgi:hypothetical protein